MAQNLFLLAIATSLFAILVTCIPSQPCDPLEVAIAPQAQHALGNFSYLVGWTLAGAALSDDELDVTCNNVNNTSHGKWSQEGLNQTYIQEVVCNASHSSPNATTAVPYVIRYSTELFVTQLLHAFAPGNTAAYAYLCQNLRYLLIDGFRLDSSRVINATCTASGIKQSPRPEGALPGVQVVTAAASTFLDTISTLYATIYASAAISDSELNIYCAHAPEYVDNINTLLLNGTLVQSTLCNITQPLNVEDARATFKTLSTTAFTTVISATSNIGGYTSWLLDNLDVESMNRVGLAGEAVVFQIQDAQD
ncbi:hypothetical protein LTR62_002471 [Meristemomyces frigidus]|uniref:Uncharacterized protein n=1 Tax=Meristemomyces frigidus TaxID=1508187 RepID=A0AAN7TMA1_9PEZI|nr:hypothetical protein LTR62_002471 [Meristemomyces frigidus]